MDRELTKFLLNFAIPVDPPRAGGLVCALLWSAGVHPGWGREDAADQQRGDSLGSNTQAPGTPQGFSVFGVTMVRADH